MYTYYVRTRLEYLIVEDGLAIPRESLALKVALELKVNQRMNHKSWRLLQKGRIPAIYIPIQNV
jgi:hypothetical protein